jgi:hypothetical protein
MRVIGERESPMGKGEHHPQVGGEDELPIGDPLGSAFFCFIGNIIMDARLAQGPLQSLKALDPDLHKRDFEAPDPRNLPNHAKTTVYPFRTEKIGVRSTPTISA